MSSSRVLSHPRLLELKTETDLKRGRTKEGQGEFLHVKQGNRRMKNLGVLERKVTWKGGKLWPADYNRGLLQILKLRVWASASLETPLQNTIDCSALGEAL